MPIFDQGYQHWHGALRGHGWRWLAVARHGVRIGMKNIFIRLFVILCWIPSLMLAGVICLWGLVEQKSPFAMSALRSMLPVREFLNDPTAFRMTMWTLSFHFFMHVQTFLAMILVLMVGPALVSQDLRFNALPLYFSRPVRRIDYFLGKLGTIGFFLALVTVVPAVLAWVLGVMFSLDFTVVVDTARILVGIVLYGFVVTLSAGLLMLALSSLTRNSRYVIIIWAGIWIFTNILFGVLEAIHMSSVFQRQAEREMRFQQENQNAWQRDQDEAARDAQNPELKPEERNARERARQKRAQDRMQQQGARFHGPTQADLSAMFRNDWRPCVSYTSNLTRIGDALLGTYAAQDRWWALRSAALRAPAPNFAGPLPEDDVNMDEEQIDGPRWPWWWSGVVLVALGGLSVWILNTRVKSLDRLR